MVLLNGYMLVRGRQEHWKLPKKDARYLTKLNIKLFFIFIAGESTYRSVRANFTVSFPVESCCPFVFLFATSGSRPQADDIPCTDNYRNCEFLLLFLSEHFRSTRYKYCCFSLWLNRSILLSISQETRMHSSRMRTARSSSRHGGSPHTPPDQAPPGSRPSWTRQPPGSRNPPRTKHPPWEQTPRTRHPPASCEQNDWQTGVKT